MSILTDTLAQRPGIDRECFRLRSEGQTIEQIVSAVDLPPFIIERLIRKAASKQKLDRSSRRTAERAIQLARLEELYASLRQPALEGDTKACQRILEVLSRQSALLGLDAPREETVTVKDGLFEQWVDQLKQNRRPAALTAECVVVDTQPDKSPA